MDLLDIVIEDPRWTSLDLSGLIPAAAQTTLAHLGLPSEEAEISVLACDDQQIARLNAEFREKESATNVLSWPAEERGAPEAGQIPMPVVADPDGTLPIGDIAIAFETCAKEADAAGKPIRDHVTHLIVHGLLHLLGYDHIRDLDATLMEGLEVEILGKMGLDNPYRDISAPQTGA